MGLSKSKYATLKSATKMTTTITGHPVNKEVKFRFYTNSQINRIKENSNTSENLRVMLSKPFCEFTKIKDNLYMTGVGGLTRENIKRFNIKYVINVTFEAPKYWIRGIQSIRIPVETTDPNIQIYFNDVSDLAIELAKSGKNLVIHCTDGVSRSATIVIAILMKVYRMRLSNAFYYLKNIRTTIRPTDQSWEQLINYENKLFGDNTVNFVEVFDSFGNLLKVPEVYL